MNIKDKKQVVFDALELLFSDTSVPKQVTLDALEDIESDIISRMQALEADIEHSKSQQ
jgi:hypothetical protein